ncbi:MAG: hypothetical protein JXC31_01265 [Acholeplasmataceae bacterium]|nr:hypothetical protein [Acholeplasmataceae bacterium]
MKKLTYVFSFILVLATVLVAVGCTEGVSAATDSTYVTIDINPSVELIVSPKEIVLYANALNEDGELLLANLDLIGLTLEAATDLIIEESINLGFISTDEEIETVVSISAISENAEAGELIRERVKAHINQAFANRAMLGRAQDKGFSEEFIAEAASYDVTPGFLFLAKSAILVDDTMTIEDALALPEADLIAILEVAKQANREVAQALKDEFMAARELLFDEYLPQIQALEAQIEEAAEDVDTTDLQTQLDTLKEEFHSAVTALRDDYHVQTEALRSQIQAQNVLRIQEHYEQVQAFKEQVQTRREQMEQAIEEFQGRRP